MKFTELEKALADSGIAALNGSILRGEPAERLTAHAEWANADLIVLSTREFEEFHHAPIARTKQDGLAASAIEPTQNRSARHAS